MERINLMSKDYNKCELTRAEYVNLLNEILFNEEWINESISSKDNGEESDGDEKNKNYICSKCAFYRKIAFEKIKNLLFNEYEYAQVRILFCLFIYLLIYIYIYIYILTNLLFALSIKLLININ